MIKIAFYKNSKSLFGKAIRFKQKYIDKLDPIHAQYSHVEILFEDGWYYGSSEIDKGVRAKKINDNKGNWDYIQINLDEFETNEVRTFCEAALGDGYNYKGIFFAQILGTFWMLNHDDYFCSEFVVKALQKICIFCGKDGVRVNPGTLHEMLSVK